MPYTPLALPSLAGRRRRGRQRNTAAESISPAATVATGYAANGPARMHRRADISYAAASARHLTRHAFNTWRGFHR